MLPIFFGTGGAFSPELGSNAAFFMRGKDLFLLDCGETTFSWLTRYGQIRAVRGRVTVFVTHLHADHAGSLPTLCLYAARRLGLDVTVVSPHPGMRDFLSLTGVREGDVRLLGAYDEGGLRAVPVPVRHAGMPACGYLLTDENETIYYSGDAEDLPEEILRGFRDGAVRRMYVDVGPTGPHMPPEALARLIPPESRGRVIAMHMDAPTRHTVSRMGFGQALQDRHAYSRG